MDWGVCTTVKAPLPQILAFVAWHKHLGAARIWVHLDDADRESAAVLGQIEGVTPVLCDMEYWAENGFRPKKQEPRQAYNMRRVYALAEVPVIAHVDVDEFLWSPRPIPKILAGWTDEHPFLRARPAEALHDADLADDIFTARQFRLPFPHGTPAEQRYDVLGEYAALLPRNMLSHHVGKAFFRTGVKGLWPKLHAATMGPDGPPLKVPLHPDLFVLHFHAQDRPEWLKALPHRVTKGAYRFNTVLADFLQEAGPDEIGAFYDATQTANPALLAGLKRHDLLLEAELQLKEKVAALF